MDISKSPAQQEAALALEFQQQWFCRTPKAVCISMYLSISGHDLRPIGHAKEQSPIDQRLPAPSCTSQPTLPPLPSGFNTPTDPGLSMVSPASSMHCHERHILALVPCCPGCGRRPWRRTVAMAVTSCGMCARRRTASCRWMRRPPRPEA